MIANYSCAVAMLIAQLAFRGMPLAQGIWLATQIRLHGIQDNEVRSLLKVMVALPVFAHPEPINLDKHTFSSAGEVAGYFITLGLPKKFDAEETCLVTRVAGWVVSGNAPEEASDLLSDAIQRAHAGCESITWLNERLDEMGYAFPDEIWAHPKYRASGMACQA